MGLGSGIRDPEKNLFRIPYPGVKKAPDPGCLIPPLHFENPSVPTKVPYPYLHSITCYRNMFFFSFQTETTDFIDKPEEND
jgi:hypothetical protein